MMKYALTGCMALAFSVAPTLADPAQDIAAGCRLFHHWCAGCHGQGRRHPGIQTLAQRYAGDMLDALENRTDFDPDTIAYFIRNGLSVMPIVRKTEFRMQRCQRWRPI